MTSQLNPGPAGSGSRTAALHDTTPAEIRTGTESAYHLEPSGDELRAILAQVGEYVTGVMATLPDVPVANLEGAAHVLADHELRQPPPERGRPLAELLAVLDRAAAYSLVPSSPGMFGFVPGAGLVTSAIAELLAGVLNRYTGEAFPAPGLVALEAHVLRWLADLFGLPAGAAGILTTGGSVAALSAVITARHARLGTDFEGARIYVTDQTHHSLAKAARLAGLPDDAVRLVAVDQDLRMDLPTLSDAVERDLAAGRRPFMVVASAGTTNAGTIDPLPQLADFAAASGLWLHVDAAYGGFFQLTERGRSRLRGIERADSLVVDPHKSLYLPFGTGGLLVRDGELLRRAHSTSHPDYLQDIEGMGLPAFADYSIELTRDFRGLRLWLPLHLHGVDAFRTALDNNLDLAEYTYQELSADPHLHVLAPPQLSTVVFSCRASGDRSADDLTAEMLHRVNEEGRTFLSSTRIQDRYVARMCVLNHRTDKARIVEAINAIRRHAAAAAAADQ